MVKSDILDRLPNIKTTVISLGGLKLVAVQYFINIINAACGWFEFTRY